MTYLLRLLLLQGILCSLLYSGASLAESLQAHWKMDEAQWSGQDSEVLDSSDSGVHGTAINGGSTADALICRGGWFRGEGYNAAPNNAYYQARYYVRVPDSNNLSPQTAGANAAVTISGWFNTEISNGTILHKGEGGNTQEYRVFVEGRNLKLQIWNRFGGSGVLTLNYTINPGQWYFFAADAQRVGGSSNIRATLRLYSDNSDTMLASVSGQGAVDQTNKVTTGDLFIGAVSYGGQPTNYFDGLLDEIRVYAGLQTDAQVLADKNVTRTCTGMQQCLADDFQREVLGDDWAVTNKSGSFGNPRIVNGRLRITDNSANVATAATFQRLFPSEGNLVTLEYDFYAYGGNGADGMAVVFSDANITPEPGGYGGSLGYANRTGVAGFAGGWLGLGLDTYGNYSNPTEGRLGGPGFRQNAIALRGSGVGQAGYRYISGTNTLSTAVRTGNPAVAHRYRVTIDSRNPANSWVTIARDTGGGFVNLIGPVDVLTSAGQAAVPEDLLLTLTGSTGGSNDIHEIDNVQVCAVRMEPIVREINHFRILHSGTGLTCAAEPVTVLACRDNNCTERFTGDVSLTMLPTSGWVGGAGYSQNGPAFNGSGGQFNLALRSSTAGELMLGISGSAPTAQNVTRCYRGDVEGSCELIFTDIGIQLDGNSVDDLKSALPAQIAGKPSNVGYNNVQQRLRVLRANSTTGACEAAIRDQTLDVQFRYQLPIAAEGLADNQITVSSGGNSQTLTVANQVRTVPLRFDNQGNGYFVTQSQDAGKYSLRADMNVPVTAPDGAELTPALAGNDTSLPFIVRPLAYYAVANGNGGATSVEGPAFRAAGDDFSLAVQAVSWQADFDTNNDAAWDQCGQPALTAPSAGPRLPATTLDQVQPFLRLPAAADGGIAGMLSYSSNLAFIAGSSVSNSAPVQYSEVGIVQFETTAGFQGDAVQVCSGYIGRFHPASISVERKPATPAVEMYTPACNSFSYMGQPFAIDILFKALNSEGQVTQNYAADFASADFAMVAETRVEPIANRLMFEPPSGAFIHSLVWSSGQSIVDEQKLRFVRVANKDGPFMLNLQTADDSRVKLGVQIANERDGVTIAEPDLIFNMDARQLQNTDIDPLGNGADIRYGRMVLDNAYGPENDNLPLVLRTEYWDGARFTTNLQDNCSVLSAINLVRPDENNPALVLQKEEPYSGAATMAINALALAATMQQGTSVDNAIPALLLPASEQRGSGKMEYQAPLWLQYYWRGNTVNYQQNPQAEFIFGRYRGNPRQIFWRESFQ